MEVTYFFEETLLCAASSVCLASFVVRPAATNPVVLPLPKLQHPHHPRPQRKSSLPDEFRRVSLYVEVQAS